MGRFLNKLIKVDCGTWSRRHLCSSINDLPKGHNVELVVGGLRYTVDSSDLLKHPESIFASHLQKRQDDNSPIVIERDGHVFKYVNAYLVNDQLPCNHDKSIALNSETLRLIKEEAQFYNLSLLAQKCDEPATTSKVLPNLSAHKTVQSHIWHVKSVLDSSHKETAPLLTCEYSSKRSNALVNVVPSVWAPFCKKGSFFNFYAKEKFLLFRRSTVAQLDMRELLAEAKQSPFGKGLETVVDTTVRNSFEIGASKLNPEVLKKIAACIDLRDFAPKRKLTLRPYKLVIYQEGGHFDQHRDTVRGDNHIGTLVAVLNSEYTGGELEISHGGKTEVVTGPYSWVAMYGDCLHKINPVTSGTRVSLIYDIFAGCGAEDDEEDDLEEYDTFEGFSNEDEDKASIRTILQGDMFFPERPNTDKLLQVNSALEQRVHAALDRELKRFETVVICLAHMYPACQTNPSFLKGGDLSLYELLKDKYEVAVEAVSMCTFRAEGERTGKLAAAMLSDVEALSSVLSVWTTFSTKASPPPSAPKTKFIIPIHLDSHAVLHYQPSTGWMGNSEQKEETVYLVSALQVRKKQTDGVVVLF